jgi:hypothetical protein
MNESLRVQPVDDANEFKMTAYRVPGKKAYPRIIPASADRMWMDLKTGGWANRCLPLRIANQAGWFILNDVDFEVTWTGTNSLDSVKIKFKEKKSNFAQSMFGFGVLTWSIPYVFRTQSGFNLIARGPANSFKDAVAPLEGVIETDWLPYPFTMNWKITRPNKAIQFERDEPICMIAPMRRNDLEQFQPDILNLTSDPELEKSYLAWHDVRLQKVRESSQSSQGRKSFPKPQGNYIRGEGVLEERAEQHQNKLKLKEFVEREASVISSDAPVIDNVEVHAEQGMWARLFQRRK